MKGFAKIALSVVLIAVVVLSIVVASVAWFTSNPEVDANEVTMTASRTLTVSFDSNEEGSDYRYHGQIGNVASGDDAPYVYEAGGFNVRVNTLTSDQKVANIKVEFGTVTVVTQSVGSIPNVLLTDLFHVEANCYTPNNSGDSVEVSYTAGSPEKTYNKNVFVDYAHLTRYTTSALTEEAVDGAYVSVAGRAYAYADLAAQDKYECTPYEIASDGTLCDVGGTAHGFIEETYPYSLTFTFTFLPDAAYALWTAGNYASICGYERATGGDYIGVVTYTPYVAKYHYGLQRYARSGTEGSYVYTPTDAVTDVFVRAETSYALKSAVTKYTSAQGAGEGDLNGRYIKVGSDYLLYNTYNLINGFPYSDDRYRGARFEFTVNCSVEEVDYEA